MTERPCPPNPGNNTPAGVVSLFAGVPGVTGNADGPLGTGKFILPMHFAYDSATGDLYVTDRTAHRIRKVSPDGTLSTVAGTGDGWADGPALSAAFNGPSGLARDASGNLYVTEYGGHRIRKISGGIVSTLAGSMPGHADGPGATALFNSPWGVDIDASGNLFVAEYGNHTIRKITPAGVVSTIAGTPGTPGHGEGTPGVFNYPTGVAVSPSGVIFVADPYNQRVRKLTLSFLPRGKRTQQRAQPAPGSVAWSLLA